MRVFIGFEPREQKAFDVATASLRWHATGPTLVEPLVMSRLQAKGLLHRLGDTRGGKLYDLLSNAPCSTEFAVSRFLVPILAQTGYVLFVDCDVVFLDDVYKLLALADPTKAVQVVKHEYAPQSTVKMDGAVQLPYSRKNWSSVILWNCDHPANSRLTLHDVNTRRGLELHQFYWLHDSEIGELPAEWNWLVGDQIKPREPRIAHFTNGGPFLNGWQGQLHDEIWVSAYQRLQNSLT